MRWAPWRATAARRRPPQARWQSHPEPGLGGGRTQVMPVRHGDSGRPRRLPGRELPSLICPGGLKLGLRPDIRADLMEGAPRRVRNAFRRPEEGQGQEGPQGGDQPGGAIEIEEVTCCQVVGRLPSKGLGGAEIHQYGGGHQGPWRRPSGGPGWAAEASRRGSGCRRGARVARPG